MTAARELYFEHQRGVTQFAYFLLGVAASAIAFAVHRTQDLALADAPWPIGAAVVLWAVSFAAGCMGLASRNKGLNANTRYLFAKEEVPDAWHDDPEVAKSLEKMRKETQRVLNQPRSRFNLQMASLFIGALAFIAGHMMLMANNSVAVAESERSKPANTKQ